LHRNNKLLKNPSIVIPDAAQKYVHARLRRAMAAIRNPETRRYPMELDSGFIRFANAPE